MRVFLAGESAVPSRCLAFFHAEHMRAVQPEPEPEQVRGSHQAGEGIEPSNISYCCH